MPVRYPLINGVRYDFSSIETNIAGLSTLGVAELTYSDNLEPGELFGTHAQRLGRTRGQYKAEGSITLYRAEGDDLIVRLGNGFLEVVFDIYAFYAEADQPLVTDSLIGCRIKKPDVSNSAGSDPLKIKFDLDLMYILHNGIAPINNLLR
ncbi:MAG TPA: hypothetical protein VNO21_26630 [Polyangiaceae bacterium]|nr:hypothetical protein [Polyangiaceae bacterium]